MSKMTPILNGNKIVGALVERSLKNEYGSLYGREFVVYATPKERIQPLMEGVKASLLYLGIRENTDDVWNQTMIYWGVTPRR